MIAVATDPRPFTGAARADLILAELPANHPDHAGLAALTALLLNELPEMEAEVGCPVVPVPASRHAAARPAILVGPAEGNAPLRAWRERRDDLPAGPLVAIDRDAGRVVVDAGSVDGIGDAFQLLRAAIAERRDLLTPTCCETAGEMLDRIDAEVRRTFPLLPGRAPGWHAALDRARHAISGPDDLATLQRLMATLGDAHSWAKDTRVNGRLPYHLHDDGTATRFWSVPEGTVAWEEGVRPGDACLAPDTTPWRERTGSAPHAKPWNIGYRALQGRVGEAAELAAIRRDGSVARWSEPVPALPWREPIDVGRLDPATGYLRVRGWLNGLEWHHAFTSALRDLDRYNRLVVDLRGNVGGALVAAQEARSRFLPGRTVLGTIRFSTVTGDMDRPHELLAEPPADGPRWVKPVRFLTDPLTYSASEDFLHGLQGLPHVQLVGQATGGGSGRPRTVALRPHLIATISTALTYDRAGRCIEGQGFLPEIPIPPDPLEPDRVLSLATAGW